jgi:hypothetical protein
MKFIEKLGQCDPANQPLLVISLRPSQALWIWKREGQKVLLAWTPNEVLT